MRDKDATLTFDELRDRLANRDAICERQLREEREEAEAERTRSRAAERERAAAANAASSRVAAVDSSSTDLGRKMKDIFMKEVSRVIVKVLDPFRRRDVTNGHIATTEDFKHLAKKVKVRGMAENIRSNSP